MKDDEKIISESAMEEREKFDCEETDCLSEKLTQTQSEINNPQSATTTSTNLQSSVENLHDDAEVAKTILTN